MSVATRVMIVVRLFCQQRLDYFELLASASVSETPRQYSFPCSLMTFSFIDLFRL